MNLQDLLEDRLAMDREVFTEVITVTIGSGTAQGSVFQSERLNEHYERLEKISIIETGNGGDAAQYKIGFTFNKDNRTINPVNKLAYQFDASCPQPGRGRRINASAGSGATIDIVTKLPAASTAELSYDILLEYSRPKTC